MEKIYQHCENTQIPTRKTQNLDLVLKHRAGNTVTLARLPLPLCLCHVTALGWCATVYYYYTNYSSIILLLRSIILLHFIPMSFNRMRYAFYLHFIFYSNVTSCLFLS